MPTPTKDETRQKFINRCMQDAESKRDFPKSTQRLAVCSSIYTQDRKKRN